MYLALLQHVFVNENSENTGRWNAIITIIPAYY